MNRPTGTFVEPDAGSTVAARRRILTLVGVLLAGPALWISHFMAVYLLAESMCDAGVEAHLLGLPLLSTLTLMATGLAAIAISVTTALAYRRWRHTGTDGDARDSATPPGGASEHDAQLALAGFLLGVLFLAALFFVGLPALVLDPCAP